MIPKSTNPHVELEERLRFETLIADLSSEFVNLPAGEVGGEIEDARHRAELAHLTRVTTLSELSGSLAHELNQPIVPRRRIRELQRTSRVVLLLGVSIGTTQTRAWLLGQDGE